MIKSMLVLFISMTVGGIALYQMQEPVMASNITVEEVTDLEKVISNNKIVVVDFGAPWCGPCVALAPKFKEWAGKYPQAKFVKVNIDNARDLVKKFDIQYVPQIFVIKGDKIIRLVENTEEQLAASIKSLN